jgi:hypothetical protein
MRTKRFGIGVHQAALADGGAGASDAGIAQPAAMDAQFVGTKRDSAGANKNDLPPFRGEFYDAGCQSRDLARIELLVGVAHHTCADFHDYASSIPQQGAAIGFSRVGLFTICHSIKTKSPPALGCGEGSCAF